jgi:hypothetical protein
MHYSTCWACAPTSINSAPWHKTSASAPAKTNFKQYLAAGAYPMRRCGQGNATAHIPCASSSTLACEPHGICVMAACCFGLLRPGLVYISVVIVRLQAGGRPAATPFSCFAKKRKQKKATQSRCPAGTRLCKSKNGKRSKLACGSDSFISNPFSAQHKRQRHMRTAKVKTSVVRLPFLYTRIAQARRATAICCR